MLAAADRAGVDALWSLGDMIGGGPDPAHVVRTTRERCHVALMGNHDYAATGSVEPSRLGDAAASLDLARATLSADDVAWMRSRRPARAPGGRAVLARRPAQPGVGVRRPVERARVPGRADGRPRARRPHAHRGRVHARTTRHVRVNEPLDLAGGKWLLNPGAVGAPVPPRRGWFGALDVEAADGAFWLELDLHDPHRHLAPRPLRPAPGPRTSPRPRPRRLSPPRSAVASTAAHRLREPRHSATRAVRTV